MPAVSQAQARLMGAIAGGQKTKATGLSREKAKEFLRGLDVSKLPARKKKRKIQHALGY